MPSVASLGLPHQFLRTDGFPRARHLFHNPQDLPGTPQPDLLPGLLGPSLPFPPAPLRESSTTCMPGFSAALSSRVALHWGPTSRWLLLKYGGWQSWNEGSGRRSELKSLPPLQLRRKSRRPCPCAPCPNPPRAQSSRTAMPGSNGSARGTRVGWQRCRAPEASRRFSRISFHGGRHDIKKGKNRKADTRLFHECR